MIIAAALCPAPPLLASELTGAHSVLPEIRQACSDATTWLIASGPDLIAVVGLGEKTRTWNPGARADLSGFAPGLEVLGQPTETVGESLPLAVGLGTRLLDQAGYAGGRLLWSVGDNESATSCARLGTSIARSGERVGLLAMADGSARRGPRAPGYSDVRSAPFDAEVERAVRAGDLDALLAIEEKLARDLMATGRPVWQVLAGAFAGARAMSRIWYSGDPFGVAYLVATLSGASAVGG